MFAGFHRQSEHLPEDLTTADPDHRRPHNVTRGPWVRLPWPFELHRQGRGSRFDIETQPGLRHEVRHAGLQQTCQYHGSTTRGSRADLDPAGGQTTAPVLHQSYWLARHVRRGIRPLISQQACVSTSAATLLASYFNRFSSFSLIRPLTSTVNYDYRASLNKQLTEPWPIPFRNTS